ncbi:MAG: hypothetical protein P4L90_03575 [Rhodopila sp.]|nr:hypothetical protein [Rhodopila sp.]
METPAPARLALSTGGGSLVEGGLHGLGLVNEAARRVWMVGNLLEDPKQLVPIGGVFKHHETGSPPVALVRWRLV